MVISISPDRGISPGRTQFLQEWNSDTHQLLPRDQPAARPAVAFLPLPILEAKVLPYTAGPVAILAGVFQVQFPVHTVSLQELALPVVILMFSVVVVVYIEMDLGFVTKLRISALILT